MPAEGLAASVAHAEPGSRPFADVALFHPYIPCPFENADLFAQHGIAHLDRVAHGLELGVVNTREHRHDAQAHRSVEVLVKVMARVRGRSIRTHRAPRSSPAITTGTAVAMAYGTQNAGVCSSGTPAIMTPTV